MQNLSNSPICPEYYQILWLSIILNRMFYFVNLASVIVLIFFVPGIIGISLSLITLYIKQNDSQYSKITPYFFRIYFMDLIVVIIYGIDGLTTYGLSPLLKYRIFWNTGLLSIYMCRLVKCAKF